MTLTDGSVAFTAEDGAVAECHPPFPESFAWPIDWRPFIGQALEGDRSSPSEVSPDGTASSPGIAGTRIGGYGGSSPREEGPDERPIRWRSLPSGAHPGAHPASLIAAHAQAPRSVGVLLVRLGGYTAGVFTGYPPALADAKTGSRLVHGRSAAGGWSQQRFARRREKQASEALGAAAATAVAVFGRGPRLDVVVLGGDKRAVAELRGDPRLAPYLALATERFLTVPDPKRAVLEGTPKLFTAVRIRLTEPGSS
jgi:Actinobacteria/chloroflexi VLRF1 release factor